MGKGLNELQAHKINTRLVPSSLHCLVEGKKLWFVICHFLFRLTANDEHLLPHVECRGHDSRVLTCLCMRRCIIPSRESNCSFDNWTICPLRQCRRVFQMHEEFVAFPQPHYKSDEIRICRYVVRGSQLIDVNRLQPFTALLARLMCTLLRRAALFCLSHVFPDRRSTADP